MSNEPKTYFQIQKAHFGQLSCDFEKVLLMSFVGKPRHPQIISMSERYVKLTIYFS